MSVSETKSVFVPDTRERDTSHEHESRFRFRESDHTYWLDDLQLPSVTQILDACGLVSPFAKQERARIRGSMVHIACRYLMENRLDWSTVAKAILPYVVSCDRWLEESGFQIEACEVPLYHPVYLYAGTYDFKGLHANLGKSKFDLKSGASCELSHQLQTAGYDGLEAGYPARGCLHLKADGSRAKFYAHRDPRDRVYWQSCLNVFRLLEAM